MGFWADIKYALNSTLGTSSFLPLDKFIKQSLLDSKRLIPSDTLYLDLNTGYLTANKTTPKVYKELFVMNMSGTFNLVIVNQYSTAGGTIEINVNGNSVASFKSDSSQNAVDTLIENLTADQGDIIGITVNQNSSYGSSSTYVNNVLVLAEVIDGTGITKL